METLGLTSKFSNGVISKHGNQVSHVTFHHKWNDIPQHAGQTLEWWLGVGEKRLELALPLDPAQQDQPKDGIPVFWSCQQQFRGGALCHYVGHFRCIKFEKCKLTHKGEPRQALIEFGFIKFQESFANKIALVPE